jgi:YD repeat-containing protein
MRHNQNGHVRALALAAILLGTLCWLWGVSAHAQDPAAAPQGRHYIVNTMRLPDGTLIDQVIINGSPVPPPGFELQRRPVSLPQPNVAAGVNILSNVPAFNWVFGCSAVSGAMIAGYYDRTGWANMYMGPTSGGVMPLTNASWPTWSDGSSTYPTCPLIASKNGVDGRSTRGSIDDYWVQYNSTAQDPYITGGWTQHAWGDAIGDYMKTSQSAYDNVDGSTTFYTWTSSATQLTCDTMVSPTYGITDDGTVGRRQFYQARGYTVTNCYNQKTDNTIAGGFSFAQFKAEIDAGRPVMLNLAGHTIVGIGYDDSSNLVYIHDTWDYNNHTFTWGTSYSGMQLLSVSIVNVQPVGPTVPGAPVNLVAAALNAQATVKFDAPASNGGASITRYTVTASTGGATCTWTAGPLYCMVSGLANGASYTFTATATNTVGTGPSSSPSNAVTPFAYGGTGLSFTDDPLLPGLTVKAVHVTELRQRIDTLRTRYGLAAFAWTNASLVTRNTPVKAVHVLELRTALSQVYTAAGRTLPACVESTFTAGASAVRAAHIAELRSAVGAIW